MSCTDSMASEDLPVHCMPWLTNAVAASARLSPRSPRSSRWLIAHGLQRGIHLPLLPLLTFQPWCAGHAVPWHRVDVLAKRLLLTQVIGNRLTRIDQRRITLRQRLDTCPTPSQQSPHLPRAPTPDASVSAMRAPSTLSARARRSATRYVVETRGQSTPTLRVSRLHHPGEDQQGFHARSIRPANIRIDAITDDERRARRQSLGRYLEQQRFRLSRNRVGLPTEGGTQCGNERAVSRRQPLLGRQARIRIRPPRALD